MSGDREERAAAVARRRRIAEVFGAALPEQTRDDSDDLDDQGGAADGPASGSDDWLRNQVPPHHG